MDLLFERYEKTIDIIIENIDDMLHAVCHISMLAMMLIQNGFFLIYKLYASFAKQIYTPFRWTTIPLNYIIVRSWLWYVFRDKDIEPLDITGVHFVRSNPGGGKSMLAYQKSNEQLEKTGYAAYHTSMIEKPRLSDDEKFYIVYHRVIDLKRYYKNGKKVLRFNTQRYKSLWVDEFHVLNNPRLNKTGEYNQFFIPFLNDLLLMRHEGFDNNIYLLSQVPNNDVQLMSILCAYHEIELKKGIDYWRWIRTGKFEIAPLYWKIETYTIDRIRKDRKRLYRKWKKRVDIDNLDHFDTHAMRNAFDHLKLDYK